MKDYKHALGNMKTKLKPKKLVARQLRIGLILQLTVFPVEAILTARDCSSLDAVSKQETSDCIA